MKKIFALLLGLVLALSLCAGALAEEEQRVVRVGQVANLFVSEQEVADAANEGADEYLEILFYDDLTSALLGLNAGEVDAVGALPECVAEYIMARNPGAYRINRLGNVLKGAYSLMTLDSQADLNGRLSAAILELKADGTLDLLQETYLTADEPAEEIALPAFEGAPTYRVLVTGDLPPMDYVSADGRPMGFNVALLAALSEKLNVNFEIVTASGAARAVMLAAGRADIVFWVTTSYVYDVLTDVDVPEGCMATEPYVLLDWSSLYLAE